MDDGVELCWGVSKYGKNSYTISYEIDNLVHDADNESSFGYEYNFDVYNMMTDKATLPTNVVLQIHMEDGTQLSKKNAEIMGIGYTGNISFFNGRIIVKTSKELKDNTNMTLVGALDKSVRGDLDKEKAIFVVVAAIAMLITWLVIAIPEVSNPISDNKIIVLIFNIVALIILLLCLFYGLFLRLI